MTSSAKQFLRRLRQSQDGVTMVEFAASLVFIVPLVMGGVELGNFVIAKMRVNALALHIADNASRIGLESLLAKPRITEGQIKDLLIGANLQSGDLNLAQNGRVILSSIEPVASPNTTNKFKIRWQRCYGAKVWPSSYGKAGDTNLVAVGPTGKQVRAPDDGGVMFVEIAYDYQPLFAPSSVTATYKIHETAAMVVRDDRDYVGNGGTGVYPTTGVTASTCPA